MKEKRKFTIDEIALYASLLGAMPEFNDFDAKNDSLQEFSHHAPKVLPLLFQVLKNDEALSKLDIIMKKIGLDKDALLDS